MKSAPTLRYAKSVAQRSFQPALIFQLHKSKLSRGNFLTIVIVVKGLAFGALYPHKARAMETLNKTMPSIGTEHLHVAETRLFDVMELTDMEVVKLKLAEVESEHAADPSELNSIRLGIIHHEVALNLSFLVKSEYKGYALRSYDRLTALEVAMPATEYLPFVASYRASALSLVGAETRKLSLVGDAFQLFQAAVERYGDIIYLPEFLRGSVAENLPWIFWRKKKFAAKDFSSIIRKYEDRSGYANAKIMSFAYWAWANAHRGKRFRTLAKTYLEKAIALDPDGIGGRVKAEAMLKEWR